MRVVIGSDHGGFELKQNLAAYIGVLGHEVIDVGTDSTAPVDYPDFAEKIGQALREGPAGSAFVSLESGIRNPGRHWDIKGKPLAS